MTARAFSNRFTRLLAAALLLAVLPWAVINFAMVANADNLWLAEGYWRFTRGKGLRESFFEVNPPLSILLYAIPAEISAHFHVALHNAIFIYTLCAVALAAWVLYGLLQRLAFLHPGERIAALAGFIVASTVMTTGFFGERDHFIALALAPLLLAQLIITQDVTRSRCRICCISFVCAVFLLLKPHFLLLPAAMILHRAVARRSLLAVLRDEDVIALLLAGSGYAVLLLWLFPDYLFHILPAVVEYYGLQKARDTLAMMLLQYLGGAAVLAALAFKIVNSAPVRRFTWFLTAMAVLALVPFVVQGLGYAYHLIPATTLFWMALTLILYHAVLKQNESKPAFAALLAIALCAAGAYAAKSPQRSFISHDAYRELPLVRAARDCGHERCSAFIFGPSFEISYLVGYYAEASFASRFGALFFLPRQLAFPPESPDRALYRALVAEDFRRYKPDTVMLASFEIVRGRGDFNFVEYFSHDPVFREEWRHYERIGYIEAPFDDYLKDMKKNGEDIMRFDIYRRR